MGCRPPQWWLLGPLEPGHGLVVGISFSPTNSRFICLEGCDMPATERGLWVEVSTVRGLAQQGRGLGHISIRGRLSGSGMCQCVQLFAPRGHFVTMGCYWRPAERGLAAACRSVPQMPTSRPLTAFTEMPARVSFRAATTNPLYVPSARADLYRYGSQMSGRGR